MGKLRVICILFLMIAVAEAAVALSSASLVPATFGFPAVVQKGTTTTFNQQVASASDIESVNIGFPLLTGCQGSSSAGLAGVPTLDSLNMFRSSLSAPFGTSFAPSALQACSPFKVPGLF